MNCPSPIGFLRSAAARRTLTTIVIALGSSIVMTLAGCASPRGIEPKAALALQVVLGAAAGANEAAIARSADH